MSARIQFDEASLKCEEGLPGETLLRSTELGWSSILVNLFRCNPGCGEFDTPATTDQRISLLVKGVVDLAVLRGDVWNRTTLLPGSALVIPGGQTQRMRWSGSQPSAPAEFVNVYLPQALVRRAVEGCGPDHEPGHARMLEPSSIDDPVVATVGSSLLTAMRRGAPDHYAATAGRWLAAHLTCSVCNKDNAVGPPCYDPIPDANVERAIRYMKANLGEPLTLDILASAAGISKFHFSRRFKRRTGTTPFAHLLGIRLEAGRRMLATTDDPVNRIANACGYERGSHFGTAFAKRFGETPTAFRLRSRSIQAA